MLKGLKTAAFIAGRYFFSRKSTHAVNIIAIVAVIGIAIVTAAMVCVLSVFNGFEAFTTTQYSAISTEYKIVSKDGKDFSYEALKSIPEFGSYERDATVILSSLAVANYEGDHLIVQVIGIEPSYSRLLPMATMVMDGEFDTGDSELPSAVINISVGASLGATAGSMTPLEIVVPKRLERISITMPTKGFNKALLPISGVLRFDSSERQDIVFVPIEVVRSLLQYDDNMVSAVLLGGIETQAKVQRLKRAIAPDFVLQDRVEQHPDIYKVLKIEKWISFALLVFVLLLSLFSVISTLGMLIIEKKEDSRTLNMLGARRSMIDRIVLLEGWLLSVTGLVIGLVVGLSLTYLQDVFGLVKLESTSSGVFLLEAYPVKVIWSDIVGVVVVILGVGWLSSLAAYRIFNRKISQTA